MSALRVACWGSLGLLLILPAGVAWAGPAGPTGDEPALSRQPPPQALEDCLGKRAGDTVRHQTPGGEVSATCVDSPQGLVARPEQAPDAQRRPGPAPGAARGETRLAGGQGYSLEQATSDRAQLDTIAFDALAFLTGDFAADTFLPPGKVSDYFGFQYMRDIDARGGGHNTSFLTRIASNLLAILDPGQKARLLALAQEQQADIGRFALLRLPLIRAFRRNLEGDLPPGSRGLDRAAIMAHSADLYELDGLLAYRRAQVMAQVLGSLDQRQKAALARLKFGDSATWPDIPEPLDKRAMTHGENVAMMTYASEMFSWQGGSLEADTYFCPERHGMYFGGFGMKTAPAMGQRDYAISTALTGNAGEAFLAALEPAQRQLITALPELQRRNLAEIVSTRRAIASRLRRFLQGQTADQAQVLALSRRYGELDGEMSYLYATAFAQVGRSLSRQQKQTLAALRAASPSDAKGPFLYSEPCNLPSIDNSGAFLGARRCAGRSTCARR